MAEDYGLTFAPIFVENLSTVFGLMLFMDLSLGWRRHGGLN